MPDRLLLHDSNNFYITVLYSLFKITWQDDNEDEVHDQNDCSSVHPLCLHRFGPLEVHIHCTLV